MRNKKKSGGAREAFYRLRIAGGTIIFGPLGRISDKRADSTGVCIFSITMTLVWLKLNVNWVQLFDQASSKRKDEKGQRRKTHFFQRETVETVFQIVRDFVHRVKTRC